VKQNENIHTDRVLFALLIGFPEGDYIILYIIMYP